MLGCVAEDFGGEPGTDDVAIVSEDVVAELVGEGVADGGIAERGVTEFVGVENLGGDLLEMRLATRLFPAPMPPTSARTGTAGRG